MKIHLFIIMLFVLVSSCSQPGGDSGAGNGPGQNDGPSPTPIDKPKPTPTPSGPTPVPTPRPKLDVGVNIHLDAGPGVTLMKQMGATWVRIDMNWSIMEPAQGEWYFQPFDDTIAHAESLGLKVYANIGYTPTWASPNGRESGVPNVEHWKAFVRTAVARYQDRVAAFGIWNEPNLDQFWSGSADQYVDVILKPACEIIRSHTPRRPIVGPDLAHLYKPTIDVGKFLVAMKNKNAFTCLDIIGHHIYAGGDFDQKINGFSFLGIVYKPGIKQWFESAGIWGRKTWITEFGHNVDGSTEADQAKWTVDNLKVMSKYTSWLERAFIFEMTDPPGADAPYHMGMTRADGSIRPAYYEVQKFIQTQ
ncbi:MAG: beta-galactosidase [Bdellovibrionia bacterium]